MTAKTTDGTVTPTPAADSLPAAAPQTPPAATPTTEATPAPATTEASVTPPASTPAPGGGKPAATAPAVSAGAPENYSPFTVADGTGLGEQFVGEFSKVARELNLSQESAQKLIDLAPLLRAQNDASIIEAVEAAHAQWDSELKADKDIGGTKLTNTLATVDRVLEAYPHAEVLGALLDSTGFRGHPEIVRFVNWVGVKIVPDTKVVVGDPVGGGRPKPAQERLAESYSDVN